MNRLSCCFVWVGSFVSYINGRCGEEYLDLRCGNNMRTGRIHKVEFNYLLLSPNRSGMINSRTMRWDWHIACMVALWIQVLTGRKQITWKTLVQDFLN